MALGLSCIVDLRGESQTSSFSDEVWSKLVSKYHTRFIMSPAEFSKSYLDKWRHAKHLHMENGDDGMNEARKYICRLQLKNIREKDARMLNFFQSLISLHKANSFMLDKRYESKVSERDYLYQLWLPIFRSLFNINNNTVGIKTNETVLQGSSEAKAALYADQTHVIGFKIDLRILLDMGQEEFDLVCGEGCLESAEDDKKLRAIETALKKISRVKLGVSVYWKDLPFLHYSSNETRSDNLQAFNHLFNFRDDVEKLALAIKRNTNNNLDRILLARHNSQPGSPLPHKEKTPTDAGWYTPPYKDNRISKVPHHTVYESGVESSDDEDGSSDNEDDISSYVPDEYGFIHTVEGWLNANSGEIYDTHPYHF
ncbi:unnamed protein product [Mucor hiemalis]